MELFLKEHDFHLFFSHDADTSGDPDYQFYCDPDINPRAGINESGFEALAKKNDALGRPLAVNLGWPFQLNSLKGAMRERLERPSLFLTPLPITESVYRRMEAERKRVANELRSTGAAEGEKIRADADRQREVTIANAYREAQKIKGDGDAEGGEEAMPCHGPAR